MTKYCLFFRSSLNIVKNLFLFNDEDAKLSNKTANETFVIKLELKEAFKF